MLGIINDTRDNAKLRSAEMYLDAVEQAVLRQNIQTVGNSIPSECQIVTNGNLDCDGETITVEVDGEVPDSGSISFEDSGVLNISLVYDNDTIVMNQAGNLEYQ